MQSHCKSFHPLIRREWKNPEHYLEYWASQMRHWWSCKLRHGNSGALLMSTALLCCMLTLAISPVFSQAASQPARKHDDASATQRKSKQDESATHLNTSSLEKTTREAVKEASEKREPHADKSLQSEESLVEYTRQLAIDTRRLAKYTLSLSCATFFIAFVAALQWMMFKRQLGLMQEDSESTKAAAIAAQSGAAVSLAALRPWLSCEVELGEQLTFNAAGDAVFAFNFIVKNKGNSPAMGVKFLPYMNLFELHNQSVARLKQLSDLNVDMGINASTILLPEGIQMGSVEYGTVIFPGESKTFKYKIPVARATLEKSCEPIKPNKVFSPNVYAIVFYTYPSATVRASTAVTKMIFKNGGAIEMDQILAMEEMRLEDIHGGFAT